MQYDSGITLGGLLKMQIPCPQPRSAVSESLRPGICIFTSTPIGVRDPWGWGLGLVRCLEKPQHNSGLLVRGSSATWWALWKHL